MKDKTVTIKGFQVAKNDRIASIADSDVISGKTRVGQWPVVVGIKWGRDNATLETSMGRIIIRQSADMRVVRQVETKSDKLNRFNRIVMMYAAEAVKGRDQAREALAERAQDPHYRGTELQRYVDRVVAADVDFALWYDVYTLIGKQHSAWEAVSRIVEWETERLIDSGADDTWSGRGNDIRRVEHDARRQWVAKQRDNLKYNRDDIEAAEDD